ncbi:hypothetical protein H5410_045802 [Solanum commersonii]|uniref:HMG box domain-containing protein n=1 Tax=Solanum commersonii TaxID=4109 RepID=A0A9J5XEQ9_SOLCO|nr:hypothetical protein H5410_045802 [Solanum commersonii]
MKRENLIKNTKENRQKKKQKEDNVDPNKPKKPASSFFRFSREGKKLVEKRSGINDSTINVLVSLKWKELSEEENQVWNNTTVEAMESYKNEMEEYNKTAAEKQNNNN